jgi:hypothetical protein
MSSPEGCKFCRRYGLPVLPVRPAVMAQDELLPRLPENINVPVPPRGETAWTARLLRQGFLYIRAERAARWINYYVTGDGYFYPLPERGHVPFDIVDGSRKPCITQPEELATASLITLPVKPAGMKNGVFWFCWSEVEWTPATRKKHEDPAYQSRYMQPFDMDAWLAAGKADQALALTALSETVAEYSSQAESCGVKSWTAAPWKRVNSQDGMHLRQAADRLLPDKGAILLLQDPPAVLQDLSALINAELQEKVYRRKAYQRELALASAITGLKEAMIRQFERDYIDKSESLERVAVYGPYGYSTGGELPDNPYSKIADKKMKPEVARKWADYEQYYDPAKVAEFQDKFNAILTRYNNDVLVPRTAMYLAWLQSATLRGYFAHNFDGEDLANGIDYVQTLNGCIAGMQDKVEVLAYFEKTLLATPTEANNILARALVLNQDALAKKLEEAVKDAVDWFTLPWNNLADAFKDAIEKMQANAAGVVGIYIGLLAGVLSKVVNRALDSDCVFTCLVATGALTRKAFIPLERKATYKEFVKNVVKKLAAESGITRGADIDRLHHYVSKELRRLRIDGLPLDRVMWKKFLVMVETEELHRLASLPATEREKAISKLLRTVNDVEAQQFSRWQGAVRRGVRQVGDAMPFTLGVVSGVLQLAALFASADIRDKQTLTADQKEAHARFWSGVMGLTGTTLNVIETAIKQFRLFNGASSRLHVLQLDKFLKIIGGAAKVLGIVAGAITAGYDFYHTFDEGYKGHTGLAVAYGLSGLAGAWLVAAIFWAIPVIGTIIAVIILLGAAIYLAFNERDRIQKWLVQCLWRRIPVSSKYTKEKQEEYRNKEAADLPIWPTMVMEMNELKLALGAEA